MVRISFSRVPKAYDLLHFEKSQKIISSFVAPATLKGRTIPMRYWLSLKRDKKIHLQKSKSHVKSTCKVKLQWAIRLQSCEARLT